MWGGNRRIRSKNAERIRSKWENLSGNKTAQHGSAGTCIIKLHWIHIKKLVVHLPEPNSAPNVCRCHSVLRNNSQPSEPQLRPQLMEQSKVFSFLLLALMKWESDVCCWGEQSLPPIRLQLEALVHVHFMVTGRWTFHPPSVTGRQLQGRRKKVPVKQRFSSGPLPMWPWRWEFPVQALSERVSGLADISADLLLLCRTPKEPHRLLLFSARSRQFNFLLAFNSGNFFHQSLSRLRFPDAARALGWRGGFGRLRRSDYHMNLCLFFERHWRWGLKQKPFHMDLHH